jgi:ABC-type multidrug transport system fused ATPase/permease subunit
MLLACLLLAGIGLKLLQPQIMRLFIDTAVTGGASSVLTRTALAFLGVALVSQGLAIATAYVGEDVAWRATNALRQDLTLHVLRLDLSFHKSYTPGELISRIDGDVNALSNFFSRLIISFLGNVILIVGILTLLCLEDWRVGLGMTLFATIALAVLVRIRTIAIPYWTVVREQTAEWYGFLGEQLAGTEDIRANGAQGYVMHRFYELTRKRLPAQMKASLAGYAMWMTNITIFALGNAVAFALSAHLWYAGGVSIGTIYLIFHYTELLRGPIAEIRAQVTDLQQAEASIERIETLSSTTSTLSEPMSGTEVALPSGSMAVTFEDVSFSYEEGDTVLHNISFDLAPGRVLGLLGRTGSGKTTLARLLLRFYDPSDGRVLVGGVSPQLARLAQFRKRVSIVTQDVQLLQATVRENLTFFKSHIPDERIYAVLEALGLSEWLWALSNGLDTELLPGGSGLSAGQAQLLAFARVFLADPGLVILDEASSRLDPATEHLVERAIARLFEGRTGIVIAHRLATVHLADEIMILRDGRVVEHGDREALEQDVHSRFYHLLRTGLEGVLV